MTLSSLFRLKEFYLKTLPPSLVYKSDLTKRDIFTQVILHIFVSFLKGFFKYFYPACNYFGSVTGNMLTMSLRDVKIPVKFWHSFRYLGVFVLFFHMYFFATLKLKLHVLLNYVPKERDRSNVF